jgi:hypothetical protein
VDLAQIIGVAGVLLILFGAPLLYAAKAVGGFIAARIPKRTPVSFAGIFSAKLSIEWWKVFVLAACLWLMASGGGFRLPTTWTWPSWPVIATKPTLIVMLHEAKHGLFPSHVVGAARELEAAGFEVRMVDDDVTDGLGETPPWLKPALEQGRAIMGGTTDDVQKDDALIKLAGERVVKAIKMPDSRAAIVEECK